MQVSQAHDRFVRVFFEVFGPSFASDAFRAKVARFFDRLGQDYAKQIRHLQAVGELRRTVEPETLGRTLASMVDGMILHKGLFGQDQDK